MRTHPLLINRQSNRLTIEQLKSTKLNFNEQEINVFTIIIKKHKSIIFFLEITKNAKEKIS